LGSRASKIVLATGVFDVLHLGHVRFLEESKRVGGPGAKLVVIVASDQTVVHRKGKPPVLPQEQRRQIVASLKPVDRAVLGRESLDFLGPLRKYKPDIVTFGHDQRDIKKTFEKIVKKEHLPVRVVQIGRYGPKGLDSSTTVKRRIANNARSNRKLGIEKRSNVNRVSIL
jgi:FAD synthetase